MPGCPQGRTESKMGWSKSDWSIGITRTGGCGRVFGFTTDMRRIEKTCTSVKCIPQRFICIYSSGEWNISIWNFMGPSRVCWTNLSLSWSGRLVGPLLLWRRASSLLSWPSCPFRVLLCDWENSRSWSNIHEQRLWVSNICLNWEERKMGLFT